MSAYRGTPYLAIPVVAGGALNWDLGLERVTAGTGTIGTGTDTTAITIGRTGITTTFPGSVTITQTLTLSALTANRLMITTTSGEVTTLGAATNGQIPIGSTSAAPVLAAITGTANQVVVTNGAGSITLSLPQSIATASSPTFAGLTLTGLTDNSLVYSASDVLTSLGAATNGQIPIGSSGAAPVLATITGTANQVVVSNGAGSITLSLPQSIATSSSPTFAGVTLTGLTDNSLVYSASDVLTSLGAATNGQIPIGSSSAAPVLATITGTANQVVVTNGAGSITLSLPQSIDTAAVVQFGRLGLGAAANSAITFDLTQAAASSGTPTALRVTGGAHTNLTTTAEVVFVDFDLDAEATWAAGNVTTERCVLFRAPTLTIAGGASSFASAATVAISAAPIAGTSTGITSAYALWIQSGATRHDGRILGAKGADIASGTTITLTLGNYFDITGTTTIDYITTTSWTAGSWVVLQTDGNVKIRHNQGSPGAGAAAILLAGAANFDMTADDTLTLVYDGTTWRELARAVI